MFLCYIIYCSSDGSDRIEKNKLLIFFILIFLVKNIFFIPFNVSGGIEGLMGEIRYLPVFSEILNCNGCTDAFQYDLLVGRAFIEAIILLVLFWIIIIIKKFIKE